MSKGNVTENDFLKMALQGVDPAWRANANVFVALHTADPGEAGTQTTSEANYTGYARASIIKASGWTDSGNSFSNAALLQFPICTGAPNVITHFSVGTLVSGAGQVIYKGPLSSSLSVGVNIQPQFAAGTVTCTED